MAHGMYTCIGSRLAGPVGYSTPCSSSAGMSQDRPPLLANLSSALPALRQLSSCRLYEQCWKFSAASLTLTVRQQVLYRLPEQQRRRLTPHYILMQQEISLVTTCMRFLLECVSVHAEADAQAISADSSGKSAFPTAYCTCWHWENHGLKSFDSSENHFSSNVQQSLIRVTSDSLYCLSANAFLQSLL